MLNLSFKTILSGLTCGCVGFVFMYLEACLHLIPDKLFMLLEHRE